MTYAEVIGWEPPKKGTLSEFLGGPPQGQVQDYGFSDTIVMADEATYFADKEVNFGDILIVLREMQTEAQKHGLSLELFVSEVMWLAMNFQRLDAPDEIEFRDFCAQQSHELDIALEKYLGIYEPDRRPTGRDNIGDLKAYPPDYRAQFSYSAAYDMAFNATYFPARCAKRLDLLVVLDAMKSEAVVKGLNARRFADNVYNAAVLLRSRNEKSSDAFRAFYRDEKLKIKEHIARYRREKEAD